MDFSHRLSVSYYKTIATLNEDHHVYLVQHRDTGKIYVKKILDVYNLSVYEHLSSNPITGVPGIVAYCEENHKLTLIEEYISGCSLGEIMEKPEINLQKAIGYLLDICQILHRLHHLNPAIIHRDIKPSNIIITNYDRAMLLDFNAAKAFSPEAEEDTVLLGTQGYAAPEQYGFGASSPQTDIYAMGVLLREILKSVPHSPAALQTIADKCTKLNPDERYQTVYELQEELSKYHTPQVPKPHKHGIRRLLPPGFRTLTPWKMLLSSVVYLLILFFSLTLQVVNASSSQLWLERFFFLAAMLSIVFGCFNYLNVQKINPLCRHSKRLVRYLGIFLLDSMVVIGLLTIMILLENLLFLT